MIRRSLAIAGRELRMGFATPLAYTAAAGFLFLSSFLFFGLVREFDSILRRAAILNDLNPSLNEWVVAPFFQTISVLLVFIVPVFTMRAFGEEEAHGTSPLLFSAPLKNREIIVGKFFGVYSQVLSVLALAFVYPAMLIWFADPEVIPVLLGFAGVALLALAFTAISLLVCTVVTSQTAACFSSTVALLLFYLIDFPVQKLSGMWPELIHHLAPMPHVNTMIQGAVYGDDLLYFFTIFLVGTYISVRTMGLKRID